VISASDILTGDPLKALKRRFDHMVFAYT